MIQRMLASALIAGFAAGLLAALLHFAFIQELILLGEDYETGALVHFAGAGDAAPAADHSHADGTAAHSHGHGDSHGDGDSGLTRNVLTVLFTGLLYVANGLMLVAGFAMAERFGHRIGAQEGILWGIAGFAALQLAPAMGLPPELPGTVAADLSERQIWWLGTVLATGTGLALIAYGRGLVFVVLGGVLIAVPHIIGAPHLEEFYGVAPPEVSAAFAARALGVGLAAWVALGWIAAKLWNNATE
ncbi:MAG: CbtA family protein [Albidovulum sp.]